MQMSSVKVRSDWSRVGPQPSITGILIERENSDIDTDTGRTPCDNSIRDSRKAKKKKKRQKQTNKQKKPHKTGEKVSATLRKEEESE